MQEQLRDHYNNPLLQSQIEKAMGALDLSPETVTHTDLAPIEEFHIGGRAATEALLPLLRLGEGHEALDIGCGTGGTARYAAATYGCDVTGIDLTPVFIETGKSLSAWLNLSARVTLERRSALDTGLDDGRFDAAWMFHVGMNIAEKRELFAELTRILKPGAGLLVYDIMRGEDETTPLTFPLPWASDASHSYVASPDDYEAAMETAGLIIDGVTPRQDLAERFFDRMTSGGTGANSPLATSLLMGADAAEKTSNLLAAWRSGQIIPVQILARKPANPPVAETD
ncbi:class I SAM-dependent methyltransferase [Henriciella litoralis]|uniref:class I SAM-dependent methyltransferase n=1 Tax=Henriciella litoralis TaxID=568102 RepID=UPI000A01AFCF|nr:methyltransferase domain-containing protein [Henriciella litoralis]